MSYADKRYLEAQQAGYRVGERFDVENVEVTEGLKRALLSTSMPPSDMRHYAFACGFLHACVDKLRNALAPIRRQQQMNPGR